MKKISLFTLFMLLMLLGSEAFAKNPVRVACVGNSITYGAFISNREKNCYPTQLQAYLGADYEVKNFGANGSTLLSKGDYPYIRTDAYKQALDFQPDIVLIKLGTNDTKPQNWQYKDEFMSDYQKLIESFQKLNSHPRVILMTPIRCFLPDGSEISASSIANQVRPMVEEIAWKNKLEIINLFNLFGDGWEEYLLPDRLHPSSIGAGLMAQKIYEYLAYPSQKSNQDIKQALKITDAKEFNFHGHQGYEFTNEGTLCRIVMPAFEAKGKPWMIRARFWGHEPQTDIAMLENGFYIVYCDVADLYGSDKAVARWDSFYKRMVKAGFNKKVALEGMSRGGLIVYNWAARNPDKVACIYADAPVMDFKSWPMGKGKSEGSAQDTKQMLSAYGFADEEAAMNWRKNPVDCAAVVAKAHIPVLHVVGDADRVVPVAENTAIFEERMKSFNAPITVIHKPGVDHHPHSLNNPGPIVRFILKATGYSRNMCIRPVPGNEYRSAAGWTEGSDWHSVAEDITSTLEGKQLKLLLLGNSITQGWGGNRKAVAYKPGKQAMDAAIGENQWESAGISGDRTQNLLWRIQHGNYNVCHPQNAVIAIGINNLLSGNDSPEEVAAGIIAVANEAKKQLPDTRIILLGLLPSGKEGNSEVRLKCNKIHQILAKAKIKGVEYINPTSWFIGSDGMMKAGLYGGDYIHLTSEGYKVWATEIAKLINQ